MRNMSSRRPLQRFDRSNAAKNIDYDATLALSSASSGWTPEVLVRAIRSLNRFPSSSEQTSFRIGGSIEGEIDLICRSLGLSGPEDFAVPAADWEASRSHRSSFDLLPPSRLPPTPQDSPSAAAEFQDSATRVEEVRVSDGGIRDLRPPPSISLPKLENVGSNWDLVRSFAPDGGEEARRRSFDSEEQEEEEIRGGGNNGGREEEEEVRVRLRTSNDDDSRSATTQVMFTISPNGRFKRNIKSWMKGRLLGSGSFGTVYEGISE